MVTVLVNDKQVEEKDYVLICRKKEGKSKIEWISRIEQTSREGKILNFNKRAGGNLIEQGGGGANFSKSISKAARLLNRQEYMTGRNNIAKIA